MSQPVIFVETRIVGRNRTVESIQIFGLVLPFIKRLALLGRNVAKRNVNSFVFVLLKIGICFLLCYVCIILLNKSSIVVDVRLSKLPRKLCPTMPIAQMAFLAASKENVIFSLKNTKITCYVSLFYSLIITRELLL